MFDWVLNTPIKWHTLYLQEIGHLEKAEPGPLEKADPMSKFTILVKLEVADLKRENNFSLKLQPKNT